MSEQCLSIIPHEHRHELSSGVKKIKLNNKRILAKDKAKHYKEGEKKQNNENLHLTEGNDKSL